MKLGTVSPNDGQSKPPGPHQSNWSNQTGYSCWGQKTIKIYVHPRVTYIYSFLVFKDLSGWTG
jgi:hypothetical protein